MFNNLNSNIINNLADKHELDRVTLHFKMLMQSCSKHESECIDNASIESYPTKVITNISDDEVDMVSSNNVDHKALLDDEAGFNEIVASSTTYRKN